MDATGPNSFYGSLSGRARKVIAEASQPARHPEGRLIVGEGDDSHDLIILVSGVARSAVFTENGREVSFHDVEAGGCFGELSAIDGLPRSASVIALTDCETLSLSRSALFRLIEDDAEIAYALLALMSGKIRDMTRRLVEFSGLNARQRVIREIHRVATEKRVTLDSAEIADFPTQQELAAKLFTRREAISREMAALQREGLIERKDGKLHIPSVAKLSRAIGTAV